MTVSREQVVEAFRRRQWNIEHGNLIPGTVTLAGDVKGTVHYKDPRTVTAPGSTQLRYSLYTEDVNWGLAPIKRRSWQARVESLTRRLLGHLEQARASGVPDHQLPRSFFEALAGELWKEGHPVTVEMLEDKAKEILRLQDRKQGLSLVRDVATGAVSAPRPGASTPTRDGF